jgi:hypothetical protein
VETEEIDQALEELEVRLERLRALYEQYFLGIEKLEPQIPRKDVDRRIYVLRREKIRNTGKRFKFQTLISRYNTFQQYWQRICREIENGTYKRHMLRAERNIGPTELMTVAARRRFGRQRARLSEQPAAPPAEARPVEAPSTSVMPAASLETPTPVRPNTLAQSSVMAPGSARPRSRTPTWPGLPTPPPPTAAPAPPPFSAPAQARPPATLATPSPPSPRRNAPLESLELDMDFMGDWDPRSAAKGRTATPPQPAAAARRTPAQETRERAALGARPAARPASELPSAPEVRRLAPPPKPMRSPTAPQAFRPSSSPPPERRPPLQRLASERPPVPASAVPRAIPVSPAVPAGPAASATAPRGAVAPANVGAASAGAAPNAAAAAAARARAARPRGADANVSEGKLRELHQRLAEVSKSAGQPTVSFDGLARSLRAAEAKLRAQHGERRIDFEVVLKNGKAVVKPVVR